MQRRAWSMPVRGQIGAGTADAFAPASSSRGASRRLGRALALFMLAVLAASFALYMYFVRTATAMLASPQPPARFDANAWTRRKAESANAATAAQEPVEKAPRLRPAARSALPVVRATGTAAETMLMMAASLAQSALNTSCGVSLDRVNDDYCDCREAPFDEPATAACALPRLASTFKCASKELRVIPSSRVGDGVEDCCDGSDEAGWPLLKPQWPRPACL